MKLVNDLSRVQTTVLDDWEIGESRMYLGSSGFRA